MKKSGAVPRSGSVCAREGAFMRSNNRGRSGHTATQTATRTASRLGAGGVLVITLAALLLGAAVAPAMAQLMVTPATISASGQPGDLISASFTITGGTAPYSIAPTLGTITRTEEIITGRALIVTAYYEYRLPLDAAPCTTVTDTITVRDGATVTTPQTATVAVNMAVQKTPLVVTPTALNLSGQAGQPVSGTVAVSGGHPDYRASAQRGSVTPSTLTAAGSLTYAYQIPAGTQPGTITDTLRITDTACSGQEFPDTVDIAITITVTAANLLVTPSAYNLSGKPGDTVTGSPPIAISGGAAPYTLVTTGGGTVTPASLTAPGSAVYSFTIPAGAAAGQTFSDLILVTDAAAASARVAVRVTVAGLPSPPPQPSTSELFIVAGPGELAKGSFNVAGGAMPTQVDAEKGTVNPETLRIAGPVEYTYPVPETTPAGSVIQDTITPTDSQGRTSKVNVSISVNPLSGIPGLSEPERSVARALDRLCPQLAGLDRALSAGEQDLLARCNELIADSKTNPSGVKTALGQLSNQQAAAAGNLITQATSVHLNHIQKRLEDVRRGASGFSTKGLAFNYDGKSVPISLFADAGKQAPTPFNTKEVALGSDDDQALSVSAPLALYSDAARKASGTGALGAAGADPSDLWRRLGGFVTGTIGSGDRDSTSKQSGYSFDTGGITAGVDYWFTPKLNLGAAVGYSANSVDYDSDGGSLDSDGWNLSAYGNYNLTDDFYVNALANFGSLSYDSTRHIHYTLETEVDREADADYDGREYSLALGSGYDYHLRAWTFGVFGRLTYTHAEIDDYTEKGADGLDLKVDEQTLRSFTSTLGLQVYYSLSTSFGVLIPQVRFDWEHEFEDDARSISNTFVNDPSRTVFDIPTDDPDRNYFHLSPSVSLVLPHGMSAFISYDATLGREDLSENLFTGGVRFEF